MKTNLKVLSIGIFGVLALGGYFAQFEVPKPEIKTKELSTPVKPYYHYGILVPDTPKGRELAEKIHIDCNKQLEEASDSCKMRRSLEAYVDRG